MPLSTEERDATKQLGEQFVFLLLKMATDAAERGPLTATAFLAAASSTTGIVASMVGQMAGQSVIDEVCDHVRESCVRNDQLSFLAQARRSPSEPMQ